MIGRRLKQLRLARNMSLESLAVKMGGMVTKQALSKYENDKARPSPSVLIKLAAALDVKASYLLTEPSFRVEFVAYRKSANLTERERSILKSRIEQAIEDRVHVLDLIGRPYCTNIPVQEFAVEHIEDAEKAAECIRDQWQLGRAPIYNATATLENNSICVMNIESNEDFDGISAIVYDNEDSIKTVVLVTRCGISGERQRLNLTHELGHLLLKVTENVDEERAAFRFGAAFLAPASEIFQEVGEKRALIQLQELLLLKKQFGMSIQALIHRLYDLDIITKSYYEQWFAKINKYGWKRKEPEEWLYAESYWLRSNVLRLVAEGLVSQVEAERILGEKLDLEEPASVIERRAFLKLPLEKRRQILAEQARKTAKHYEAELEQGELVGGDVIEY